MPDAFDDSTAQLEELVRKVMKERDPVKYHQLAAEIRRVLEEREKSGLSCGNCVFGFGLTVAVWIVSLYLSTAGCSDFAFS